MRMQPGEEGNEVPTIATLLVDVPESAVTIALESGP